MAGVCIARPDGDGGAAHLFVIGHVRAPVVRVRLRFADGDSIAAGPTHGLFVLPSRVRT